MTAVMDFNPEMGVAEDEIANTSSTKQDVLSSYRFVVNFCGYGGWLNREVRILRCAVAVRC